MASNKTTKEQIGVELEEPTSPHSIQQTPAEDLTPSRPDWLPEKFKDEQEFSTSYKNLENELRERSEAQKRLEGQIGQLTEVIDNLDKRSNQAPQPAGNDQALRDQLTAAYENDPIGTMAYLAQQYAEQTLEAKLSALQQQNDPQIKIQQEAQNQLLANAIDHEMASRHSDWNDFRERVGQEIQQDSTLVPDGALTTLDSAVRTITRVYENVKAKDVLAQHESGNFVTDQMKRQAQTLSGGGVRQGAPDAAEEKFAQLKQAVQGMSYSAIRG